MQADIERWNRRYLAGDGLVKSSPEPELGRLERHISGTGLALELACGKGANALYLASRGYQVVAADCAIEGLRICQAQALELNLPIMPVVLDFDYGELPDSRFDLVSVIRYLNRSLFPAIAQSVKPGGLLFYKTFNQRHLVDHPNFNSGFVLQDGELAQAFKNFDIILSDERGSNSILLARKLG